MPLNLASLSLYFLDQVVFDVHQLQTCVSDMYILEHYTFVFFSSLHVQNGFIIIWRAWICILDFMSFCPLYADISCVHVYTAGPMKGQK